MLSVPILQMEETWQQQSPKMDARMVRPYDQDERQSDGSMQWNTIRSVLFEAFAKHGARLFSEKVLVILHSGRKQQGKQGKN